LPITSRRSRLSPAGYSSCIIAIYQILVGIVGLNGLYHFVR
jgi:hypothetical protein